MHRRLIAICLASVLAAGPAATVAANAATTCAAPAGADAKVATIDGRQRLHWIDQRLTDEAARGRFWARAWALGIGAAGVASLVPVPFVAPGDRVDWYASAVTAAIGVIPFAVSPLAVTRDGPKLRAAVATLAMDDDARVCALLADAESKLAADAADETRQQGWWTHAGNLAFNTAVLLFLGLGYHHWTSGLINGVSGVLVGETIIFTQPTRTIDDLAAYHRGELSTGDGQSSTMRGFGLGYHTTF